VLHAVHEPPPLELREERQLTGVRERRQLPA
jgi:hypothetical protein